MSKLVSAGYILYCALFQYIQCTMLSSNLLCYEFKLREGGGGERERERGRRGGGEKERERGYLIGVTSSSHGVLWINKE